MRRSVVVSTTVLGWLVGLSVLADAPIPATPPGWPPRADAVVAADGSGQFQSVQAAIAAAPTATRARPWVIYIKAGVYRELLYVQREKRFLCLIGEDRDKTILTYDLYAGMLGPDGKPIGTFRTPTAVIDADDFTAEDLTFENAAGPKGQALAVRVEGERVAFRGCRFLGWQDTVFINRGRQYFEDCTITGHVDFIFGGATAYFERCHIHARGDGYLTAASTPDFQPYGFVFSRCKITGESPETRAFLGRPWRSYSATAFLNTEMSEVVRPSGWNNWSQPNREKTVRYAEHGSSGPGASAAARVAWARRLSADEAALLTSARVLAGSDGWDPQAEGRVATRLHATAPPAPPSEPACPKPARFVANVEYARAGRQSLRLDICVPGGQRLSAAALLVHGGGWARGDKSEAAVPLRRPLITAGIAWVAVGYRLAPQHQYPAPVEDVEAAIRWVKRNAARFGIDGGRLALVGESAGGHLVASAAVRMKEDTRLAAVVPFFAPVDLEADTQRRGGLSTSLRGLFGRSELDDAMWETLRAASPLLHVRAGLPPFLLVHGTADMSVPYDQSTRLQARLKSLDVPCELITIPDGTHGLTRWDEIDPTYKARVVAWLASQLAPKAR